MKMARNKQTGLTRLNETFPDLLKKLVTYMVSAVVTILVPEEKSP